MTNEVPRLLYEGALAVVEGRQEAARELLLRVIEQDEHNEQAWLWLSGAVDDPEDQKVALENVLAINPHSQPAHEGLEFLRRRAQHPPAAYTIPDGPWVPPPPWDENEVVELPCWQCGASVYSVAPFCWQCNAPVHACNNCVFRLDQRCKPLQGLTNAVLQTARNDCEWWRPAQ
jgi:hypothetical protein